MAGGIDGGGIDASKPLRSVDPDRQVHQDRSSGTIDTGRGETCSHRHALRRGHPGAGASRPTLPGVVASDLDITRERGGVR